MRLWKAGLEVRHRMVSFTILPQTAEAIRSPRLLCNHPYSQNWMYGTGDYRNPPSFGIASQIPENFAGCIGVLPVSLFGIES